MLDHKSSPLNDHSGGGENDEIWLISYSDMMTLLFGFFVLMYVFSASKETSQEEMKKSVAKQFGGTYSVPYEELAKQLEELKEEMEDTGIISELQLNPVKDGLEITFRSVLLFELGSADMLPEAQASLETLTQVIFETVNSAEILVAGHTDDIPISTDKFPSNWELSASRAATVVKVFEKAGYPKHLLVAMGYGEGRPAFPNRNRDGDAIPENRELNRRVVLKVVAPGIVKQPSPAVAPPQFGDESNGP